jgi:hypothetical protein
MPQNALKSRTLNFNALNMAPYEGQFNVKDTGYKGRRYAGNVYSGLLPELMRAHFPEYIAFSPATVTTDMPTDPQHAGVFTPFKRTIALNPDGTNSMLMEPYGNYGYVGVGSNTTTEETLNALRTMLHESTHARTNLGPGQKRFGAHPAKRLKSLMPRDRFEEMMTDIRLSGLPSVYEQTNPSDIINEYFATATPARQMSEKNMSTRRIKSELKEVQRLADKYPELEKMRRDWERPELFAKD